MWLHAYDDLGRDETARPTAQHHTTVQLQYLPFQLPTSCRLSPFLPCNHFEIQFIPPFLTFAKAISSPDQKPNQEPLPASNLERKHARDGIYLI
ncbi:hypothetical protein VTL71DRAFT_15282 [Oculimacula yallundae]|uniref:Uncharacterized protein n=1 Tax=Oculimacula yallundae TaxID=86028 RepID=A0ABR4CIF4_9HELO